MLALKIRIFTFLWTSAVKRSESWFSFITNFCSLLSVVRCHRCCKRLCLADLERQWIILFGIYLKQQHTLRCACDVSLHMHSCLAALCHCTLNRLASYFYFGNLVAFNGNRNSWANCFAFQNEIKFNMIYCFALSFAEWRCVVVFLPADCVWKHGWSTVELSIRNGIYQRRARNMYARWVNEWVNERTSNGAQTFQSHFWTIAMNSECMADLSNATCHAQ